MSQVSAAVDSSQRIDKALGAGLDAFWQAVAKSYPEIQSGDLGFDDPFVEQAQAVIERWVEANRPRAFSHDQLTTLSQITADAANGDYSPDGSVARVVADLGQGVARFSNLMLVRVEHAYGYWTLEVGESGAILNRAEFGR